MGCTLLGVPMEIGKNKRVLDHAENQVQRSAATKESFVETSLTTLQGWKLHSSTSSNASLNFDKLTNVKVC
jgi:hypothetical protein